MIVVGVPLRATRSAFRFGSCLSSVAMTAQGGDWLVFRRNRCLSPAAGKKTEGKGKRDWVRRPKPEESRE